MNSKRSLVCILLLSFVLTFSNNAFAVEKEDFLGAWLNNNQYTAGITRVLIAEGTLRGQLVFKFFGSCYPYECDWDTVSVIYSGNPITVIYTSDAGIHTLTLTYSEKTHILHIHSVFERPGISIFEYDYYFSKTSKPDLTIREIDQPTKVITYGETPWVWYTFTVHNLGAAWTSTTSEQLYAKIVNLTRDGEPVLNAGYFDLSGVTSLDMGEYTEHSFAVSDSLWSPGYYKFQVMIDHDDLISEDWEHNNVSNFFSLTVLPEHQIAGTCEFNNLPVHYYTSEIPSLVIFTSPGNNVEGAELYYYPESSVYAVNNIPEDIPLCIYSEINAASSAYTSLPGNYRTPGSYFTLSDMTSAERENYSVDYIKIMHMTRPRDNENISPYIGTPQDVYQPGIVFEWAPVPGADEYTLEINLYRDYENPGGYGFISDILDISTTDTRYVAELPSNNELEHYQIKLIAYDSNGDTIGICYTTYTGGVWSVAYRFKVDYNCYPELAKPNLHVVDVNLIEGDTLIVYSLEVSNVDMIPDELFASAPDLDPCGGNTESSRTWVRIYDIYGGVLKQYCAFSSAGDLNMMNFSLPVGDTTPLAVYAELEDRRCGITYTTTIADTAYACPLADLDDDCAVTLSDFSIMAAQWLMN